jgi:hypothetical protein
MENAQSPCGCIRQRMALACTHVSSFMKRLPRRLTCRKKNVYSEYASRCIDSAHDASSNAAPAQ